jgi:hypothetical protein
MSHWPGTAVTIGALLVAAWCLVEVARNRPPGRLQYAGLAVVEALVLVHLGAAIVALAGGARPHEYGTFLGYLIAYVIVVPMGFLLARAEPTRWGSVIACVACLIDAVVVVRLNQVWSG